MSKKRTKTPPAPTTKKVGDVLQKKYIHKLWKNVESLRAGFLSRRPHRSFKLTRRRDYARSLELPGYWSFTRIVGATLMQNKSLFLMLALLYAILNALFVGLSSQEAYSQLAGLLSDSDSDLFGGWGQVGQASLLVLSGISGSFIPQLSDVQQVYAVLFLLLTWLSTVWLLRSILAGNKPKLRDGLYGSGAPVIPTGLVLLVLIIQLAPIALAVITLNVAASTGFLMTNGLLAMLSWLVIGLIVAISLYWAIATVIALVVVTLPGMYPWQAIRSAGDLVIGRRVRVLLRVAWAFIIAILFWVIIVLPVILFDSWLKSVFPAIDWLPLVPLVISLVTSLITVWGAAYVYLLYRKVVEDDAQPA